MHKLTLHSVYGNSLDNNFAVWLYLKYSYFTFLMKVYVQVRSNYLKGLKKIFSQFLIH